MFLELAREERAETEPKTAIRSFSCWLVKSSVSTMASTAQPASTGVAMPTTAGTGSEVGRSSVISEDRTHLKRVVFSPKILARKVFADPELMLALPPHVAASHHSVRRGIYRQILWVSPLKRVLTSPIFS